MNNVIRVTSEFLFEMAHVLKNYDGPCRNVHGHSYKLFVTVSGVPVDDSNNPKNGMVMDFTVLKEIVMRKIVSQFDHSVVVSRDFDKEKLEVIKKAFGNLVIVDYTPTCENLVADFARRLEEEISGGVKLHSIRLFETARSYAEWYATDNE